MPPAKKTFQLKVLPRKVIETISYSSVADQRDSSVQSVWSRHGASGHVHEEKSRNQRAFARGNECTYFPPVWDILLPLIYTTDRRSQQLLVSLPKATGKCEETGSDRDEDVKMGTWQHIKIPLCKNCSVNVYQNRCNSAATVFSRRLDLLNGKCKRLLK